MAKGPRKVDARQGDLFACRPAEPAHRDPAEGELNDDLAVRVLLTEDVRSSGLSRWEIAGRMGLALGVEVTKWQVDSWTAESKEGHRFPLAYTGAWCWATHSRRLVEHLVQRLGLRCLSDTEAERAGIQKEREELRLRQAELRRREAALRSTSGRPS